MIFGRFDWEETVKSRNITPAEDRNINNVSDKIDDPFTTHVKMSDAAITDSIVEAGSKASFVDTCSMKCEMFTAFTAS